MRGQSLGPESLRP